MSSTRRPKRFLSPEQKYDLWVRMLTGQLNQERAGSKKVQDEAQVRVQRAEARISQVSSEARGPP